METQATPRPWKHIPTCPGGGSRGQAFIRGYDPDPLPIGEYVADVMIEEDSALIVRAVNCHDALVEALESFRHYPCVGGDGCGAKEG